MLPKRYIFNHIAKTGGNSLLAVCRANLEPAEIGPHLTEPRIRLLPGSRFEQYRLIAGHFSLLTQSGFCRSRYSITLLRDPIKRSFSAYTFWRTSADYNPVTGEAKTLSFADFVRYFADSPSIIHNPYTHHFAAIGRDCPGYCPDKAALLAAAKHNLSAFNFVGVCEEMDRSARLLCRELGWPAPAATPHENRSSSEDWFNEIDDQTMEILRDRNRLDIALHGYAAELLQAREGSATGSPALGFAEPNRFVPFPSPYQISRRATIRSVSAEWDPDESSRMIELAADFTAEAPVAELNFGVLVTDADGAVVWGSSTSHESLDLRYDVGRASRAAFLVECDLPPGKYRVSVSLSEPRRLGFHEHWIDHATFFTVAPPRAAPSRYRRGMRSQEFRSTVEGTSTASDG